MDLSFFLKKPVFDQTYKLVVNALNPLAMTETQPGTYYQSSSVPSENMLFGMLENALGWQFGDSDRKNILKGLRKKVRKKLDRGDPLKDSAWLSGEDDKESGVGYMSLLQHHVRFVGPIAEPSMLHFEDVWARHVRGGGTSFPGGSRNYDYRLERIVNLEKASEISFGDRASYKIRDPKEIKNVKEGDKVHLKALRPQFPQYYVSPTKREYVWPRSAYIFPLKTSFGVKEMLSDALQSPASPLYLGTSDGWVEAKIKD